MNNGGENQLVNLLRLKINMNIYETRNSNGELESYNNNPSLKTLTTSFWHKNGLYHRENGPAILSARNEEWYLNGERHRVDGPAIIRTSPEGKCFTSYFLFGQEVSEEQHKKYYELQKITTTTKEKKITI